MAAASTGASAPTDLPSAALSAAQRRVLLAVKRQGEATADQLAAALEISPSAVRQHLAALRTAGLVEAERRPGGPGRPVEAFRATLASEPLFAPADALGATEVLAHAAAEDPAIVGRIFDRRSQLIIEDAQARAGELSPAERVELITSLLDDQGYIADHESLDDRHFRINLRSCALWSVASQFDHACGSELDVIRALIPEADVDRSTSKIEGSHTCSYDITLT